MLTEKKLEPTKASFHLQTVYLKDLSFESPISRLPGIELRGLRFDAEFETQVTNQEEKVYEVSLSLTGKGLTEKDETIYLVEVTQAGTFLQSGEIAEELIKKTTLADCPTVLFPYLRETVDSILLKGGWPAVTIAPIDFASSYSAAQNS